MNAQVRGPPRLQHIVERNEVSVKKLIRLAKLTHFAIMRQKQAEIKRRARQSS
jgi:hypothetical protein